MGVAHLAVLLICISFAILVFTPSVQTTSTISKIANATETLKNAQITIGGSSVIPGTLTIPNIPLLFKGMADLITSIFGAVYDVFNPLVGLPPYVLLLFTAIFVVMIIFKGAGWAKGTDAS